MPLLGIFSIFLLLFRAFDGVDAAQNVTVDDSDTTSIVYEPVDSWRVSPFDPLSMGGHYSFTRDSSATATFTFTGVAIYFFSPLWSTEFTTAVSLDGQVPILLKLQDPNSTGDNGDTETAPSQVVWQAEGLDNTQHTLIVSVGADETSATVDSLVYTVPDPDDPTTSSSSSTPSSSTSKSLLPPPTPTSNTDSTTGSVPSTAKTGLSIALGIVCTVFGLLVVYAFYWYWRRRRRRLEEEEFDRAREEYRQEQGNSDMTEASAGGGSVGYGYQRARTTPGLPRSLPPGILRNASGNGNVPGNVRPRPPPPRVPSKRKSRSSPLATQSPLTAAALHVPQNPLSPIPEMRTREEIAAMSPLSMRSSRTSRSSSVQDAAPSEPPWSEVGVKTVGSRDREGWTTFGAESHQHGHATFS